jgi:Ca2+-binding EF-hand superfamily protein
MACDAGHITPDELQQALHKAGVYSEQEVKDILKKVDKDKDGCINYEEFVSMMVPKQSDEPVRRRKVIKF